MVKNVGIAEICGKRHKCKYRWETGGNARVREDWQGNKI
jgi:hypothetical protein